MNARIALSGALLAGVIVWLVFGQQKELALATSIPVVLLCRWLVIPANTHRPKNPSERERHSEETSG